MAARRSDAKGAKLSGSHNRSWIWGRHLVLATLRAGVWSPRQILIGSRCPSDVSAEVRRAADRAEIPCETVADDLIEQRCRAADHQGLAALMPEFPYASLDDVLQQPACPESWLILDRIQDSFNFGSMVRSAVELGTHALLIGATEQSPVNSQVARSSAGAVNLVPIVRHAALAEGIQRLKGRGFRIIAASEKGTRELEAANLCGKTAIVIGNEGRGVSAEIWDLCDEQLAIPTSGRVGSLNAAVAAGIFCYERLRQRNAMRKETT